MFYTHEAARGGRGGCVIVDGGGLFQPSMYFSRNSCALKCLMEGRGKKKTGGAIAPPVGTAEVGRSAYIRVIAITTTEAACVSTAARKPLR